MYMASKETNSPSESHDCISAHPTLAVLYPDVTRIMLFVAFEEADSESEPNYQQIIFTKETEAVFHLDCSRDECVGGGFDFAPFVEELMGRKESRSHGVLACKGSLGSGEDAQCCSLKAEYRIIVD
jgi:hypothetical protein